MESYPWKSLLTLTVNLSVNSWWNRWLSQARTTAVSRWTTIIIRYNSSNHRYRLAYLLPTASWNRLFSSNKRSWIPITIGVEVRETLHLRSRHAPRSKQLRMLFWCKDRVAVVIVFQARNRIWRIIIMMSLETFNNKCSIHLTTVATKNSCLMQWLDLYPSRWNHYLEW